MIVATTGARVVFHRKYSRMWCITESDWNLHTRTRRDRTQIVAWTSTIARELRLPISSMSNRQWLHLKLPSSMVLSSLLSTLRLFKDTRKVFSSRSDAKPAETKPIMPYSSLATRKTRSSWETPGDNLGVKMVTLEYLKSKVQSESVVSTMTWLTRQDNDR